MRRLASCLLLLLFAASICCPALALPTPSPAAAHPHALAAIRRRAAEQRRDAGAPLLLTNATAPAVLESIATLKRQVILVVFTFDKGQSTTQMVGNWASHVHRLDLLRHVLMVTAEPATQARAAELGLRVYLDLAIDPAVKSRPPGSRNSIHDIQKHFWSMKAMELGYRVLYSDVDAVHLRNPLPYLEAATDKYDLQGLTDDSTTHQSLVGVLSLWPCGIYRAARADTISGSFAADLNYIREHNITDSQALTTPCQSTGYWYAVPTAATIRFFFSLTQRVSYHLPHHWEQAAYNELIMGFLIGIGDEGPIRYRLLPIDKFSNIGVWEKRQEEGKPIEEAILLHAGGVYGFTGKSKRFDKYDLWEQWAPEMGMQFGTPLREELWGGLPRRHLPGGLLALMLIALVASSAARLASGEGWLKRWINR